MTSQKIYGTSLLTGTALFFVTMGLHPVGGSFEHMISMIPINITAHSIGISSLPFMVYGFLGLTLLLRKSSPFADAGLVMFSFSAVSGMMAASLNGLVLSFYLRRLEKLGANAVADAEYVLDLIFDINKAMDFIFIITLCVAALLYSIALLRSTLMPKWIAWVGIVMGSLALFMYFTGFEFITVAAFRNFIFSYAAWTGIVSFFLIKKTT